MIFVVWGGGGEKGESEEEIKHSVMIFS